jgi:hypothetical protein
MLGGLRQTSFTDELGLPQPAWTSLPTTKMKRPNRADAFAWCYSYTGFSLAFARAAIAQLGVQAGSSVVDPFVEGRYPCRVVSFQGYPKFSEIISPVRQKPKRRLSHEEK